MKVKSAQIDHTKLGVGLHLVETLDGGISVYDLRMVKPVQNNRDALYVLFADEIHTMEHLLAFYLREVAESCGFKPEDILTVYPYGCQTGFGCLAKVPAKAFKHLLSKALCECLNTDSIPFCDSKLCGNVFLNDFIGAKRRIKDFLITLDHQTYESILEVPLVEECAQS